MMSAEQIGGKGRQLAELALLRYNVPRGFIITAEVFRRIYCQQDSLITRVRQLLSIDLNNAAKLEAESAELRQFATTIPFPSDLKDLLLAAFDRLGSTRVAVRSSSIHEDGAIQSFAGQFDSHLNIDRDSFISAIQQCWASLFTARSIAYRSHQHSSDAELVDFAVVIQAMIPAKVSGVLFTIHPISKDRDTLYIDAVWGLGESLVSGAVTPDTYVVSKQNLILLSKTAGNQAQMRVGDATSLATQWMDVPTTLVDREKLNKPVREELCRTCIDLDLHLYASL